MAEPCWILARADGREANNGDHVEHFNSEADAAKRAANDESGYVAGCTPRRLDQPCLIVSCGCKDCTEVFDEAGEGYNVHFDNADEAAMVTEAEWAEHPDGTYRCIACSPGGDCDCLLVSAAGQSGETPRG